MDFTPRNDNSAPNNVNSVIRPAGQPGKSRNSSKKPNGKLLRYSTLVLLFSITALVVALAVSFAFSNNKNESRYVKNNQLQAVFLNGGQVYFGNISQITDNYLTMSNVYYLRVNQSVQPNTTSKTDSNDVSLVKLGCELHGPEDRMVINQSQIIFWENLKNDGQVAKAVTQFRQQNPNGQNCSNQTSATNGATGTTNNAGATTNTGTTAPTTETKKQ